jgi:hypothetical protein
MRQVENHVRPSPTSATMIRVPPICMLLSALFHERVSFFAINMLLLQRASITE